MQRSPLFFLAAHLLVGSGALLLLLPQGVRAWGSDAHWVTASLAQRRLSARARSAVQSVLAGQDLPDVCVWADQVRSSSAWKWSGSLHYVNTREGSAATECKVNMATDCPGSTYRKQMCVIGAVSNFTAQLLTRDAAVLRGDISHADALKFIVHFFDDISQPMHASFARGGNDFTVYFFDKRYNLHSLWDSGLIKKRMEVLGGGREDVLNEVQDKLENEWAGEVAGWEKCHGSESSPGVCPLEWADESAALACDYAWSYGGRKVTEGESLSWSYYEQAYPLVERRLAMGAVRLSAFLNRLYATDHGCLVQA